MSEEKYELLAFRFARMDRSNRDNHLVAVKDEPVGLDFFFWGIRKSGRKTILVDMGFSEESAKKKNRGFLVTVPEILGQAAIDPANVSDVIVTHLHHDHVGHWELFPNATFHVQEAEMAFVTSRHMKNKAIRGAYEAKEVGRAIEYLYAGRLRVHSGTATIAPGISVHLTPGHTAGQQIVRVPTARGWVVLASDAAHYWANIRLRSPFPVLSDVIGELDGYDIIESLADGPDHIIPGHDPEVTRRFPALSGDAPNILRLDAEPLRASVTGAIL